MERECEELAEKAYPLGVPPEWKVTVRRTQKEDGRYLIYYSFEPAPEAPELEIQAEEKGTSA